MVAYKWQSWKWHFSIDQSIPDREKSKYKCPEVGPGWHVSGES